jgi:hypothetical protein
MRESIDVADWKTIENQLPVEWRRLASEMGLVKKRPPHIGQKIDDIGTALRLVLHYVAGGGSMRDTVAMASAGGLVTISQVALFKWVKKIGGYLEELVVRMEDATPFRSESWGGYELIAADATAVMRPGATGTTARIHYGMRLATLTPRAIRVTDVHVGETLRNFDVQPGELWILDRGYANPPNVEYVIERGSDLLVRYNRESLPVFDAAGARVDVNRLLSSVSERGVAHEERIFVRARGGPMRAARLCFLRLAQRDANKARERMRREGVLDAESLAMAEYIVILTTADESRLDATKILALYRARWQVELDFKRDKTIGGLDALPNFLPESIRGWLCAKVLLGQIARRLASQRVAIPPSGLAAALLPPLSTQTTPQPTRPRRRTLVRDALRLDAAPSRAPTHWLA